MGIYFLMHKNEKCAVLNIDEVWNITDATVVNQELTPYLGNADAGKIKEWWVRRLVPASREMVRELVKTAGYVSNSEYLAKNLALSVTDCYWVCPEGHGLRWEDVYFSNMRNINDGKIPYHNQSSYDMNASLGGQMEKYWDLNSEQPQLVKEAYRHYGQQSVNEYFATEIHRKQKTDVPFIEYRINKIDNGTECRCDSFVTGNMEFVPAYEVINSEKTGKDRSLYEAYISICAKHGADEFRMRRFMDYQTLSDFVVTNEDRHWGNFGVLRDPETLRIISPAPVFDFGNSMFFKDDFLKPLEKHEILARKINAMHDREEKMLKHLTDKNVITYDLLPDPRYVFELYRKTGIPEEKAHYIAANYGKKLELTREFQEGRKISCYMEKVKIRNDAKIEIRGNGPEQNIRPRIWIMTCGLPGTGKTELAERECRELEKLGMKRYEASQLYSAGQALSDTTPFFAKEDIINKMRKQDEHDDGTFTLISLNDIRRELTELGESPSFMYLDLISNARITAALSRGYSVIYDAMNLDQKTRVRFIKTADEFNVPEKRLIVTNGTENCHETGRDREELRSMAERLYGCYPSKEEGWTDIREFGDRYRLSANFGIGTQAGADDSTPSEDVL